jgi:hypothetical protein
MSEWTLRCGRVSDQDSRGRCRTCGLRWVWYFSIDWLFTFIILFCDEGVFRLILKTKSFIPSLVFPTMKTESRFPEKSTQFMHIGWVNNPLIGRAKSHESAAKYFKNRCWCFYKLETHYHCYYCCSWLWFPLPFALLYHTEDRTGLVIRFIISRFCIIDDLSSINRLLSSKDITNNNYFSVCFTVEWAFILLRRQIKWNLFFVIVFFLRRQHSREGAFRFFRDLRILLEMS